MLRFATLSLLWFINCQFACQDYLNYYCSAYRSFEACFFFQGLSTRQLPLELKWSWWLQPMPDTIPYILTLKHTLLPPSLTHKTLTTTSEWYFRAIMLFRGHYLFLSISFYLYHPFFLTFTFVIIIVAFNVFSNMFSFLLWWAKWWCQPLRAQ